MSVGSWCVALVDDFSSRGEGEETQLSDACDETSNFYVCGRNGKLPGVFLTIVSSFSLIFSSFLSISPLICAIC